MYDQNEVDNVLIYRERRIEGDRLLEEDDLVRIGFDEGTFYGKPAKQ